MVACVFFVSLFYVLCFERREEFWFLIVCFDEFAKLSLITPRDKRTQLDVVKNHFYAS